VKQLCKREMGWRSACHDTTLQFRLHPHLRQSAICSFCENSSSILLPPLSRRALSRLTDLPWIGFCFVHCHSCFSQSLRSSTAQRIVIYRVLLRHYCIAQCLQSKNSDCRPARRHSLHALSRMPDVNIQLVTGIRHTIDAPSGCKVSGVSTNKLSGRWHLAHITHPGSTAHAQVVELRRLAARELQLPQDRLRLILKGQALRDAGNVPALADSGADASCISVP